uniref:DUF5673 domain-containing protein n=1 Tax=candidate division CPR3 bacterium TaxID=2268181 RepID=A0A7C5YXR1_UNCC3
MSAVFGFGDIGHKAQIQDLQRQIDELKKKLAEKEQELLPSKYRVAKIIQGESKILHKWNAPSRPFVKRGKQWYWTVALVTLTLIVILAFFQEAVIIAAVIGFMFIIYLVSTVPPAEIEYRLTEFGVEMGTGEDTTVYTWDQLDSFWISLKQGREILNIDTKLSFPLRIVMLFPEEERDRIVTILSEKLPYKEAPKKKQGWLSVQIDGIYIPYHEVRPKGKNTLDFQKSVNTMETVPGTIVSSQMPSSQKQL